MKWVTVDTRQMDTIEPFVDGFIHLLPSLTMKKHWVQMDCWCDPSVFWGVDWGTCVVRHNVKNPNGKQPATIHPES